MNLLSPLHYNIFVRFGLKLTRGITMLFLSAVLAFATYTLVSAAPTITATLTDTFIGGDGDGKADPGETIEYTAVITNSGADPATGVTFNDVLDLNTTLVAGSINVSPLAGDDAYQTIGNTLLEVGVTASGSPAVTVSGSLFDNDTEFLADTFTLKSVEADTAAPFTNVSTEQSGTVTVESDGNFSYTPAVGFSGTDNFDYVITDDGPDNILGNGDDLTGAGRVTITVTSQRVWYVKNDSTPGGLGRSSDPFDTLAEAQTASAANDTIYVFTGNGTTGGQSLGIVLKAGQRLLGEGVALTVPVSVNGGPNPTTLRAAGSQPQIDNTSVGGNGVSVTDLTGVEVRGLNIAGNTNAIDVTTTAANSGSFEIANNTIRAAGVEGIDVNGGGSGTLTVSIHDNTVTATGNGIDIARTAGSVNITAFDDNNINGNTGGIGVNVVGTGASILFDTNPGTAAFDVVSGGATTIGQSGNGVGTSGLILSNIRGDLSFSDLDIYSDAGTALFVNGTSPNYTGTSGTRVVVNTSVSTLSATGGAAADITDANVNLVLTSLSSANSTGSGVALTQVSGTFTGPSGSAITNASSADVSINGGSNGSANVAFTYGGTITDDLGTLVQIQNVTASSTHSFTGAITDNNDGDGSGISLTGNSGATITFSGGLLVSTGANPAFTATGGGTVNVCDENPCNPAATGALVNTLTTTTGTALNVNGTTIGANNLEFRSISSSGGSATGIILVNSGSTGALIVKGNGGTAKGGNGSGGTITNKTGGADGDGSTASGVYINNGSATLRNMILTRFDNFGVYGLSVNNVTVQYSTVGAISGAACADADGDIGTSSGAQDAGLVFGKSNPSGLNGFNNGGTALLDNLLVYCSIEHQIEIYQQSNSFTATISNSDIKDNSTSFGSDGVQTEMQGTASATITVDNVSFDDNKSQAVQAAANDSSTLDMTVKNSTVVRSSQGNEGIVMSNGSNGDLIAHITNNNLNGIGGVSIFVGQTAGNATAASSLTAFIQGNTIVAPTTASNHALIAFLTSTVGEVSVANILIDSNNITQNSTTGAARPLLVDTPDLNTTPSFTATVTNNTIAVDGATGSSADVTARRGAGCFDVRNNTVGQTFGIRVRQVNPATVNLEQGVSVSGAAATVLDDNHAPGTVTSVAGTATVVNNSTCLNPPVSLVPNADHALAQNQPDATEAQFANTYSTPASKEAAFEGLASQNGSGTFANTLVGGGKPLFSPVLPAPALSGETVTVPAFTLPAGKSVTIKYRATVNNPLPQNASQISTQGTVSGSNFSSVSTDDPSVGGASDPTVTPIDLVDLKVTKGNNAPGGTVLLGTDFTWQIQVSNDAASRSAIFTNGQVVLEDHLPSSPTYDAPSVVATGGVTGLPDCSITSNVLTCTAPAGGLIIPGGGEAVVVAMIAHTNTAAPGALVNPTGGVCKVDPNALFAEVNTANNSCSDTVTVTRPNTTVTSINRQTPSGANTNASSVTWRVTFANAVSGVTSSNFTLTDVSSSIAGELISTVTAVGGAPATQWDVTASTGTGDGTLRLDFANDSGMNYAVTNAPYTSGQTYTIDKTGPLVSSIVRQSPASSPTNADVLVFRVTFNEAVTSVGASSFVVNGTTTTITSVNSVTPNLVFDLTLDGGVNGNLSNLNGTVGLNIAASPIITDLAGNTLQVIEPTPAATNDQTYDVDNSAPSATSFTRQTPSTSPTNADTLVFRATFSEDVTGVGTADFAVNGTTTATVTGVSPVSASIYDVTVSGGDLASFNGVVGLNFSGGMSINDLIGNALPNTEPSTDETYTLDNNAPTATNVTSSTANGTYTVGSLVSIQVEFSEAVTVTGTPQLTLETGTTDRTVNYTGGSGTTTLTFGYTVQAGDTSNDLDYTGINALALNGGTVRDAAANNATLTLATPGNAGSLGANKNIVIDTTAPTVTNVTSTQTDGSYGTGVLIPVTVTFSEPVNVTGTPTLALNSGATATASYTSGSGTTTLTFNYTTANGDASADLDYDATNSLTLNGGTIQDAVGNNAVLTLAAPGAAGSLGANKAIVIDATEPGVTSVTSSTANGSYKAGSVISIQVNFSEIVNVTGTPQLTLETGTTDRVVNYTSGSGTNALTFDYTVQAGDTSSDLDYTGTTALALNGGSIKDASTNDAFLTLPTPGAVGSLGANKAIVIDTTAPTVTNVTSSTANGTYTIGQVISIQVVFSETVNVTGTPQLTLETGATDHAVNYTSGSGTATLTFNYTVQAGDATLDLDYIGTTALALNGGAIKDIAANDAVLTLATPGAAGSLGNNKDIVIDTSTPTITNVTSSTTNGAYNVPDVISIQVTFSKNMTVTGTPQLTLETGATDRVVNYSGGSGTATLTFNYTVQAGDTSSDLDYSGTTALALNGGTIRDAALNNADLTLPTPGNPGSLGANKDIVIDTTAPAAPVVTTPANGSNTADSTPAVSGTAEPNSTVTVFIDTISNGTAPVDGSGNWSYNVPSALSEGSHTVRARASDAAGNTSVDSNTNTFIVDTTAPDTIITAYPTNPTNSANASFSFTGNDGGGSGVVGFQCKLDGGSFTACTSPQSYSSLSDGSHTFQVRAIDAAGNIDPTPASFTWTVDTAGSSVVVSSVTASPTNVSPITITITFNEAVTGFTPSTAAGDIVIGGVGGTDSNPTGSGSTYSFDLTPSGQGVVTITVPAGSAQDASTNFNTVSNILSITYDTASPTVTINQASGQADPTSSSPVNFTAVFNEAINPASFTNSDVTLGGTANPTTVTITQIAPNNGTTFNVAVNGMGATGTVTASIQAAKVTDLAGNNNSASTSSDNTVNFIFDTTAPTVVSSVRADPSPTNAIHVRFTVTFSEFVTGVDESDFAVTMTGVVGADVISVSGSGSVYTVTVNTGSNNGTIRLDVLDDNSIVDALLNPLGAGFTSGEAYTIIGKTPIFADVPFSYWANSYIERLYNAGITGGCGTNPLIYCPDDKVTRAQMAVFLLRTIHGSSFTPAPATGAIFNDVPATHWAAAWIEQFYAEGLTAGCGNGNYCPEQVLTTRAQMAVFLLRARYGAGYIPPAPSGTAFNDVPADYWAAAWIEQLAAEGITSGCGGGNYCPEASLTRAEMAVFLVRTLYIPKSP